ncbi:hypothetical protein BESB_020560 [Besnoitia besnoiti]|uniref:Transmembrane protein n=1 Tax=Besnoitia besnoiti TaxID=94643 RepID=A0A2A9M2A0_BESBE|nr:hypothetical protein BESB_020560 [Besnoitia besnoiti]PFH32115.1 hypothetical protein BESB_020560 [Besnoitia besnoiti]
MRSAVLACLSHPCLLFLISSALLCSVTRRTADFLESVFPVTFAAAVTPPFASPQASLWVSVGPTAASDKASRGTMGLEDLRVGANVLHKWTKGFDTRLHLSADTAALTDGASKSLELCGGKRAGSLLARLCEALEVTGEAAADGGSKRLRTVVRFDLPTGRSHILCAATQGNHELQAQFCPPHEGAPAETSVSSSHFFQKGAKFVRIQPAHDFSTQTSQLRVQSGRLPQAKDDQWMEVNLHVARQHLTNAWDTVVGIRQHFDGGRVVFAPYLRLKDRSLRYEYSQSLSNGGVLRADIAPAQALRIQWSDPSASGGTWVAQAELPLRKGASVRDGTIAFRREWAL